MNHITSRIQDFASAKAQSALLTVLAAGPIPKHVAFIMDGNRRYARSQHKQVAQGHGDGFEALKRILEMCMKLGVRCVSAYAFAIENFKRSPEEVGALMKLAEEKLVEMAQHGELLDQYGIRLNIIGKKDLLPPAVQAAVKKAEDMTRHNNKAILNLCMSYASRDDITSAVEASVRASLHSGRERALTQDDIDAHIMTSVVDSPPVDILVRTSGVKRVSDFLTWQCCEDTQIQFTDCYWPDFGLWDLLPIILDYQQKVWRQKG
ncbi:Di-trans-poly-cis-decaprenylcistransferase [Irpex rosettiformis]|uniref:Di-trans-poly-cis-decaprenylcistransferase n=1 Tax=Irpex rosettiformis TaxID=378272 RepID=A0ACB8TZ12_9APHY|nr:Di-trans-poly-cis-decaprenylcistransferase [Irpex rosettiformis]